jgi:uncharacterized membrane protein YqjE
MNESDPQASGWLDSFHRIGDALQGLIRSRIELFAVELQEEKLRFLRMVVLLGIAMIVGGAGLLVGVLTLAIWLWNTTGYFGLILLSLATLILSGSILFVIYRQIRNEPPAFGELVAEFKKDTECLGKK